MKKTSLILAAVILGFLMTACHANIDKKVKKSADTFFTQAEERVQAIDNIDDFMDFYHVFSEEKTAFAEEVFLPYINGETANIPEGVRDYIFDRATAYNKVESAKCTEILTPLVERYEALTQPFYERYLADEVFDAQALLEAEDPDFIALMEAEAEVLKIDDYDNLNQDLAERIRSSLTLSENMFTLK